jgi:hypothetical protein
MHLVSPMPKTLSPPWGWGYSLYIHYWVCSSPKAPLVEILGQKLYKSIKASPHPIFQCHSTFMYSLKRPLSESAVEHLPIRNQPEYPEGFPRLAFLRFHRSFIFLPFYSIETSYFKIILITIPTPGVGVLYGVCSHGFGGYPKLDIFKHFPF